jgi:Xaa-Pro aminopeptidase
MAKPVSSAPSPKAAGSPRSATSKRPAKAGPWQPGPDPKVPEPVYHARLNAARERLAATTLPYALITNPLDVAYLTGFLGGDSYLLLPVHASSPVTIISDSRYEEELSEFADLLTIVIRRGAMNDTVAALLKGLSVTSIAVQSEHVTLALSTALSKLLGRATKLVPTQGLIAPLREIKDEHEVRLIKRAVAIQEAALLATLPAIRLAMKRKATITEADVAARLEMEMKVRGSSQPGFESIIAAQANGSLPHYRPSAKVKLKAGWPLLIDWGAIYQGYHSDMTRTFTLGTWSPKMREIYTIVREAFLAAASVAGPGKTTRDVDAAAREVIKAAGYGDRFGHGTGHGIGFNAHEAPSVSHMAAPTALRPGMIITIEPGIYLPGVGGVRIEDDFLITPKGCENLCSLPTDLSWATL